MSIVFLNTTIMQIRIPSMRLFEARLSTYFGSLYTSFGVLLLASHLPSHFNTIL